MQLVECSWDFVELYKKTLIHFLVLGLFLSEKINEERLGDVFFSGKRQRSVNFLVLSWLCVTVAYLVEKFARQYLQQSEGRKLLLF